MAPLLSPRQARVLRILRDARLDRAPWLSLPEVHRRTLNLLVRRGWIDDSVALDGVRYAITAAGLDVLGRMRQYRDRSLCTVCKTRPRAVSCSGWRYPQCRECNRAKQAAYYAKAVAGKPARIPLSQRPCADCHSAPREVSGGHVRSYCTACRKERIRRANQRRLERRRQQVEQGDILWCGRCHKRPVMVTRHQVYEQCSQCIRQYWKRRARVDRRRRLERKLQQVWGQR